MGRRVFNQLNVVRTTFCECESSRRGAERGGERTYVLPLSGVTHCLCEGGAARPHRRFAPGRGFPSECSPAPTKPVWPPLSARTDSYGRLARSPPSHARPRTQQFPNCHFYDNCKYNPSIAHTLQYCGSVDSHSNTRGNTAPF